MIAYVSRTGNVRDIVGRLDKSIPIREITASSIVQTPYYLLTYTDKLGEAPEVVRQFLSSHEENRENLRGVIASGNTNFGKQNFCGSAIEISQWLRVPIIRMIDLRGNQDDIATISSSYSKMIAGEQV